MTLRRPPVLLTLLAACLIGCILTTPARAQTNDAPPISAPDDVDPLANAGQLIDESRWAEAAEAARLAIAATPDRADAWLLLGYALHADGRIDEALPAHLMAAEFPETAAIGMYNAACAYSLKDNADKAIAWLRRAREAGFDDFGALRNDADLNNIRNDERFAALVKPHHLMRAPEGPSVVRRNPNEGTSPQEKLVFLLGDWRLTGEGGREIGGSRVESRTDGVFVEHRTIDFDGPPLRETTVWWYETASQQWRSVAVRSDGAVTRATGAFRDLAWTFEGRRTRPDGVIDTVRTVLRPLRRGGIRRADERTDDAGAVWTVEYDVHYTVPPPTGKPAGGQ